MYAEGIYADYTVKTQVAPVPLQGVVMPPSNPFIPADLKRLLDSRPPRKSTPLDFGKRLTERGPRVHENNYDMHQLTAGARGRLPGDWDFDVYAQYGASSQWKYQTGNVSRSKVEELTFAPDGGVSICGGFNPFGRDSVLPACADYIAVDAGVDADVRQWITEATARGAPIELPAGDLRMAIGVQYRSDEYQYRADEALRGSCRTAVQTSSALKPPTTLMRTTTTPMCTSRPRFRSSLACPASSHSNPCLGSVIPIMRPRAGWTLGRPSCCISR